MDQQSLSNAPAMGRGQNMITNIQFLRAFAAINVVLFHIIGTSASYGTPVVHFEILRGWGANGVDIFFAISGFVMVFTQESKRKSAVDFFRNRVIRIVPIYWILTFVLIALLLMAPSVFRDTRSTYGEMLASLFFVSQVIYDKEPLLYVGWTLEYEMLFYALFAIGLLVRKKTVSYLVPALALIVCVIFGWSRPLVLEFVFGMFCAGIYLSCEVPKRYGIALAVLGAALLLSTIWIKPGVDRVWSFGLPSFMLLLGFISIDQTKNPVVIFLGGASYSIYLVQVFTIPAFYKVVSKPLSWVHGDLLAIFALLFSVGCGCVFYKLVESPIDRFLKGRRPGHRLRAQPDPQG